MIDMKRINALHIFLEIIVILGNLVVGMTLLTYLVQGQNLPPYFIASIIIAMGVVDFVEFFSFSFVTKFRSVQYLIGAITYVALGVIALIAKFDIQTVCVFWGAFCINYSIIKIITAALNMTHQPLLNSIRTVLAIIAIVLSILLIVRTTASLHAYVVFTCVALIVEAVTLFVEFMVHRYQ